MEDIKPTQFLPDIYQHSPIFSDLGLVLSKNSFNKWPSCDDLMSLIGQPVFSRAGVQISMQPQDEDLPNQEMSYEERIYKTGVISTRENNWHDFFNAMIWSLYPQTKCVLNSLHMAEIKLQNNLSQRSKSRDAITHLDESGIVVVSDQKQLIEQLRGHEWMNIFYDKRELWGKNISAYVFGHGLYEKALQPFIGFTGKMYALQVEQDFFKNGRFEQYRQLDKLLAEDIYQKNKLKDNQFLSPLPVLGVPGWYKENTNKNFYLNTHYFRPKS